MTNGGRSRAYDYADLIACEIVNDLEAALEQFREIAAELNG